MKTYVRSKLDFIHKCKRMQDEWTLDAQYLTGMGFLDVDFIKAFDSVDITFGIEVCKAMGLGEGLCEWIRLFYRGAKAAVIVNGMESEPFNLRVGIRQGGPFSPVLFLIVVEALAITLRADRDLACIKLNGGEGWDDARLQLSQYADDLTIYLASRDALRKFRHYLVRFGRACNLHENQTKGVGIWWGTPIPNEDKGGTRWLQPGEHSDSLGIRYGTRLDPRTYCEPMITRVEKAIARLSGMSNTPYGRATLVQSKAMPVVVFYARVIFIPDDVIKDLQKKIEEFIWLSNAQESQKNFREGRAVNHVVASSAILRPTAEGGLPIQRLATVIQANQAWMVRKWLQPAVKTYKSLPRYWVSKEGEPFRRGFSNLLTNGRKLISEKAPLFYQQAVKHFQALRMEPTQMDSRDQWNETPLWRNPSLSNLGDGDARLLAQQGIVALGQVTVDFRVTQTLGTNAILKPRRPQSQRQDNIQGSTRAALVRGTAEAAERLRRDADQSKDPTRLFSFQNNPLGNGTMKVDVWSDISHQGPQADWLGRRCTRDNRGMLAPEDKATTEIIRDGGPLLSSSRKEPLDPYGAGDINDMHWMMKDEHGNETKLADTSVKKFYLTLNRGKLNSGSIAGGTGLRRHIQWAQTAGILGDSWISGVFTALRTPMVSQGERYLTWGVLHTAVRTGARLAAETRAGEDGFCPFCTQERRETVEHAFATCPGVPEVWQWAMVEFLGPAGGAPSAAGNTSTRSPAGEELDLEVATPEALAGMLGLIKVQTPGEKPNTERKRLFAWWTLIRASILTVLQQQRATGTRLAQTHGTRFSRPTLRNSQERVMSWISQRAKEEISATRAGERGSLPGLNEQSIHQLEQGIFLKNILGRYDRTTSACISNIGTHGLTPGRDMTQHQKAHQPKPTEPTERQMESDDDFTTILFDGASKGNPGEAGCGALLKRREQGAQVKVCEASKYLGRTTNNEAEYNGCILGLEMARARGVRKVMIKGDSQLVIRQLTGEWACKRRPLIVLQEAVRKLMVAFDKCQLSWIRRKANSEADALANEAVKRGGSKKPQERSYL